MPTREEMNSLAQGIISSYDARVEGVAQIRNATQAQLRESHRAHQAMGRQLRVGLARGRSDLRTSVRTQIQELDRTHNAMGRQLRADLSQAETARTRDEAQRARERGQVVAQRKSDVGAQLQELDEAHQAMGRQLRADLSHAESAHRRDEAQRARERGQVVTQRNRDVAAQLQELHTNQAGARAAWEGMAATLAARRGGAAAVAEAPAAPPVAEAPAPVPPTAETPVEEEEAAVAGAEVGEVTSEFISTRDGVFAYLANQPNGTRLVEIERELGLSRLQAARVVRNLMDEGKVAKRGLLYFAI